jgi:hypothetical protein
MVGMSWAQCHPAWTSHTARPMREAVLRNRNSRNRIILTQEEPEPEPYPCSRFRFRFLLHKKYQTKSTLTGHWPTHA